MPDPAAIAARIFDATERHLNARGRSPGPMQRGRLRRLAAEEARAMLIAVAADGWDGEGPDPFDAPAPTA